MTAPGGWGPNGPVTGRIDPDAPPASMGFAERERFRVAARQARQLGLGPVGELVHDELMAWQGFAWRLSDHGRAWRLLRWVEAEWERRAVERVAAAAQAAFRGAVAQ